MACHPSVVERPPIAEVHRFLVRLPKPLRDHIVEAARGTRRSINSEIVARLEESVRMSRGSQREALGVRQREMRFTQELSSDEDRLVRQFRLLRLRQQRGLLDLLSR